MQSLLALAAAHPTLSLAAGRTLLIQGLAGGDLYVLESGELAVERDGVKIATISTPGSPVGEMSVILGTPASATVRAERPTTVRVVHDAVSAIRQDPELSFRIAWLMANRLDSTSAYLVKLTHQHEGKAEHGLIGAILAALHKPNGYEEVSRGDMFGSPPPPPL
ncbi:MAG: Crp/Fnr family transcriptional regulator [Devosia sp.]|uniref:Crp/Fnr family transcriptional regulator n=1 Tax=Devosia sp. TaxID=1871048 RepID=UPI001AC35664|nr:Crp/Fnr family transcriptional regulator [Devosia sp.]MBN9317160.1 Crp/Fnr family transcriptional regulator [Devosia sp.]